MQEEEKGITKSNKNWDLATKSKSRTAAENIRRRSQANGRGRKGRKGAEYSQRERRETTRNSRTKGREKGKGLQETRRETEKRSGEMQE